MKKVIGILGIVALTMTINSNVSAKELILGSVGCILTPENTGRCVISINGEKYDCVASFFYTDCEL